MLVSGAANQMLQILPELSVDARRMRANLDLTGGMIMSEAVMMGLAPHIGRGKAHDLVYGACARCADGSMRLKEALLAEPDITRSLSEADIDALLDPAHHTGAAGAMVDEVVPLVRHSRIEARRRR